VGGWTASIQKYQDSVAEITEDFIALFGPKCSPLSQVVFLEEKPANGFGPISLNLPLHSN